VKSSLDLGVVLTAGKKEVREFCSTYSIDMERLSFGIEKEDMDKCSPRI
jgi:hypothetical protein